MSRIANPVKLGRNLDYTPSAAVSAGDVVFVGSQAGVAPFDIAKDVAGTVDVCGVFDVAKASGAVTLGAVIYWDATNKKATTTASGNALLGIAVLAALSDDATVRVLLNGGNYAPVKASAIADAASTVSGYETINAILAALRNAGIVAANA